MLARRAGSRRRAARRARRDRRRTVRRRTRGSPQLAGLTSGEIAYFAVLSEPNDSAHAAALVFRGARVLRSYRSVDRRSRSPRRPPRSARSQRCRGCSGSTPVQVVRVLAGPGPGPDARDDRRRRRAGILERGADRRRHPHRRARHRPRHDPPGPQRPRLPRAGRASCPSRRRSSARARSSTGAAPARRRTDGMDTVPTSRASPPERARVYRASRGRRPLRRHRTRRAARRRHGHEATDGTGVNSDLLAALEWAAMPAGTGPAGCESIGADVVNLSLGSESRPARLNTGNDIDLVSYMREPPRRPLRDDHRRRDRATAARSSAARSRRPGSASQVLSVAAAVEGLRRQPRRHAVGRPLLRLAADSCTVCGRNGHPAAFARALLVTRPGGRPLATPRRDRAGLQHRRAAGGAGDGDGAERPQLQPRASIRCTPPRADTSMATPATAGGVALMLQAYRAAHGAAASPQGASGLSGLPARAYALVRAALMNTARTNLYESRWVLTTGGLTLTCDPLAGADVFGVCSIANTFAGTMILYEVRNGAADPYVGPARRGGRQGRPAARGCSAAQRGDRLQRRLGRRRGGRYRPARPPGHLADRRDQGGDGYVPAIRVARRAGPGPFSASFSFLPGNPSDGSRAITAGKTGWRIDLPGKASIARGGDAVVNFKARVPADAAPGSYTGTVVVTVSNGQTLRIPVFASVALHDGKRGRRHERAARRPSSPRGTSSARPTPRGPSRVRAPVPARTGSCTRSSSRAGSRPPCSRFTGSLPATTRTTSTSTTRATSSSPARIRSTRLRPGTTDALVNGGRGPTTAASPQTLTLDRSRAGPVLRRREPGEVGLRRRRQHELLRAAARRALERVRRLFRRNLLDTHLNLPLPPFVVVC